MSLEIEFLHIYIFLLSFIADHHHLGRDEHGHLKDSSLDDSKSGIPIPPSKPKIWSLADTAVCKTPPPPAGANAGLAGQPGQQHLGHHTPWAAAAAQGQHHLGFGMSALRAGNMFGGMNHMQRPAGDFGQPAAQLPSHSPSVSDGNLQTDTPPHTPPNNNAKNGAGMGGLAGLMGGAVGGMFNGYSGLHNGYAAAAAGGGGAGAPGGGAGHTSDASKLLSFNHSSMNTAGSFKMM